MSDFAVFLKWASENGWIFFWLSVWLVLAVAITLEIAIKAICMTIVAVFGKPQPEDGLYTYKTVDDRTILLTAKKPAPSDAKEQTK